MKISFDKCPAPGAGAVCAAAAGLLLGLYPEQSAAVLIKAAGALALFFGLSRLVHGLGELKAGGKCGGCLLLAAGFLLAGLLFFLWPRFLLYVLPFVMGLLLVIYGVLRVPMIWERWSWGLSARLSGILWVLLSLAAGALLLFFPAQAALILIRLCGFLLLLFGIMEILSGFGCRDGA